MEKMCKSIYKIQIKRKIRFALANKIYKRKKTIMIITNQQTIIRTKTIDDGSTSGKKVYQTADGRWWEETICSKENAQTGQIIGYMQDNIIKW